MDSSTTGWERNKRTIFDNIVLDYDKIRPEYPIELFMDIFDYSLFKTRGLAIEIGAGTGKATYPFLKIGSDITAIELSSNMASFLLERYNKYDNFNVIVNSFENVNLSDDTYDLIFAASSFHWVDAEIGLPKARRLLKNNGAIALFRYNAIADNGEKLYDEIQDIYEKYYYSYYTSTTRPYKKTIDDFLKPSEIYISYRFESLKDYGFKDISMKFYNVQRTFNSDEYIALLDTMSDHKSLPDSNRAALYTEIKDAILKHGNLHKVNYIFQLYMGRK